MGALAAWVQMRAFQMQAQKPRHALPGSRDPRRDDLCNGLGRIGDQCGQQACCAKPGVGGADMGQGLHIGRPIHRNPAAAVYLQIDQPRRKDTPVQRDTRPAGRAQRHHPAVVDDKGRPVVQPCTINDFGPREGILHKIVSVTFRS